jgi:ABC-2 type transport system ATP-binding protein
MPPALAFDDLSKTFGRGRKRIEAVRHVSLEVQPGQVYGFLGPNGAGKTTSIRVALSLMLPTTGRVFIYGQDVAEHHDVLRRVGMLVEGPAFYPYLNGRRNLQVLAGTHGNLPLDRIDALLQQVGLTERPKMRYRRYSLGMKQRLGLAAALLHDPDLLVLDEPTNGLDPAGMAEMRAIIRDLADNHGKTIFLSSHLLNEVEHVCDHVAIINRGAVVREGVVADLLAERSAVRIRAHPLDRTTEVLSAQWTATTEADGDAIIVEATADETPDIVRLLVSSDIDVHEVSPRRQSLEELFLSVTTRLGDDA